MESTTKSAGTTDPYGSLVEREKALRSSTAEVLHADVYWPVSVVTPSLAALLTDDERSLLRQIEVGYGRSTELRRRLGFTSEVLGRSIAALVSRDLIEERRIVGADAREVEYVLREGTPAALPLEAADAFRDAPSGFSLDLPEAAVDPEP